LGGLIVGLLSLVLLFLFTSDVFLGLDDLELVLLEVLLVDLPDVFFLCLIGLEGEVLLNIVESLLLPSLCSSPQELA
jgi:hypothetical protein